MKIIDFHAHIYPDKIADKATHATSGFYEIQTDLTGTAGQLIEKGTQAGISEYVILPVATKASQVHSINEFVIEQTKLHSCFHGFGTIHAETENKEEELEFLIRSGLKGLKLHPDTQGFNTDDERLFPVYDYIAGKIPVLIHCGDPRYAYSRPERLKKMIQMFPKLQVIAAHLGGWSMFDVAYENLRDTDCYLDISSCTMFLEREQVKKYINGYGADRILFGTDFPLWNPMTEVQTFMQLDLSERDREKIAYQNAQNILY